MAVTRATLAAVARMRADVDAAVSGVTATLTEAWGAAWSEVSDELEAAIAELILSGADGDWPTGAQVRRSQRAVNALKLVAEALDELSTSARVTMTRSLPAIVRQVEAAQEAIARSQLPDGQPGIGVSWSRVDGRALEAIVKRSTRAITSSLRPLSPDAQAAMRSTLIRGVAVGEHPRAAARQMLQRTQGVFNGGLSRALTISRTELLDASRAAATASRTANGDVLGGWRWMCTLGKRTCPSCIAKHGELHVADDPGPQDHVNGRCTAVPVTKSWRDLGIELPEPADTFPDARKWFGQQDRATQVSIMGEKRLEMLNSGRLSWDDMSVRRENPGWRPSFQVPPLPVKEAAARRLRTLRPLRAKVRVRSTAVQG